MSLKMYFNGSDWVIAESPDDATELCLEQVAAESDDDYLWNWREVPMEKVQRVWIDPDGTIAAHDDDGATLVEMTVAEEIAKFGRCYVGTADY